MQTLEIPAFSHLSLSVSRTLITPKCVVSFQSGSSCFSLSAREPPLFTRVVVSCHLAPAPLSLLTPSYLPALTLWRTLVFMVKASGKLADGFSGRGNWMRTVFWKDSSGFGRKKGQREAREVVVTFNFGALKLVGFGSKIPAWLPPS